MTGGVVYRYGNKGSYEVKILGRRAAAYRYKWLLLPLSNLYFGKCKSLSFGIRFGKLDLNTFCPNVESINIGSLAIWSV